MTEGRRGGRANGPRSQSLNGCTSASDCKLLTRRKLTDDSEVPDKRDVSKDVSNHPMKCIQRCIKPSNEVRCVFSERRRYEVQLKEGHLKEVQLAQGALYIVGPGDFSSPCEDALKK